MRRAVQSTRTPLRTVVVLAAFGVALSVFTASTALAQTFTVLYKFTGGADGGTPYSALIMDAAGNLYGTTYSGGSSGYGTVYMLDTKGNETVLHSFTGGGDGVNPDTGLTMDHAGNLYGTTSADFGSNGTVFKLSHSGSSWTLNTLYTFTGGSDGANPSGRVIFGLDGSLNGIANAGGSAGNGTLFRLQPPASACKTALCPWTETVLHSFTGAKGDGADPRGRLDPGRRR